MDPAAELIIYWTRWQAIFTGIATAGAIASAALSAGLLIVAWRSVVWAKKTFEQREQQEAAKEVPNTALILWMLPLDFGDPQQQQSAAFIQDDDPGRLLRWFNHYRGAGRDVTLVTWQQRMTCYLSSLGPGLVTTAETDYTVEVYDAHPSTGVQPAETFRGTFRFYNAPAGELRPATTAVSTTHYPYFRIVLGSPIVRDIAGTTVDRQPDQHLSRTTYEYDNTAFWAFAAAQREAWRRQQAQARA